MKKKTDLYSLYPEELKELVENRGFKSFRGQQLIDWIYKGIDDFDNMSNLPKKFREDMKSFSSVGTTKLLKKYLSEDGVTTKYLFLLEDNNIVEGVAMNYSYGNTLCVSTQVGCRMGCSFCESTKGGLIRNLTVGEMVSQFIIVNQDLGKGQDNGFRNIRNIVLMGSGEPLDNYQNVLKFLKLLHHPATFNMSYRNMTLSTCGITSEIRSLADEALSITLAVSLHAANDKKRASLMPIARSNKIVDILDACMYYFDRTSRRISFEYSLIEGINDSLEDARELGVLLKGFPCHVNLIPINEVKDRHYMPSKKAKINEFINVLNSYGVNNTLRRELGSDIGGACGQLKSSYLS